MTKEVKTNYEKWYEGDDYYWGLEPAELCKEIAAILPKDKKLKILDIGCGEGKDIIYFGKLGYEVSGFDITENGIRKTKALALREGVEINAYIDDVNTFELNDNYDVIYSTGTIQYLDDDDKKDRFFEMVKSHTNVGGINWFNVFVDKPFIPLPPDWDKTEKMWMSGDLFSRYPDWKFLRVDEEIFECHSSGVPHLHCMDVLFAKKMK
ncbi:MAG: methyltransferase domain-containing protein [Erysipelotrichaceae bacterium]|nr:methyltransferase domain-containing protein [Erysipelotrichaceae bacterium]